eukprot:m.314695 g.314695  ORF g.314695 m.314695 type:complete len:781 (-) comp20269_c0_seq1:314-2656(-)
MEEDGSNPKVGPNTSLCNCNFNIECESRMSSIASQISLCMQFNQRDRKQYFVSHEAVWGDCWRDGKLNTTFISVTDSAASGPPAPHDGKIVLCPIKKFLQQKRAIPDTTAEDPTMNINSKFHNQAGFVLLHGVDWLAFSFYLLCGYTNSAQRRLQECSNKYLALQLVDITDTLSKLIESSDCAGFSGASVCSVGSWLAKQELWCIKNVGNLEDNAGMKSSLKYFCQKEIAVFFTRRLCVYSSGGRSTIKDLFAKSVLESIEYKEDAAHDWMLPEDVLIKYFVSQPLVKVCTTSDPVVEPQSSVPSPMHTGATVAKKLLKPSGLDANYSAKDPATTTATEDVIAAVTVASLKFASSPDGHESSTVTCDSLGKHPNGHEIHGAQSSATEARNSPIQSVVPRGVTTIKNKKPVNSKGAMRHADNRSTVPCSSKESCVREFKRASKLHRACATGIPASSTHYGRGPPYAVHPPDWKAPPCAQSPQKAAQREVLEASMDGGSDGRRYEYVNTASQNQPVTIYQHPQWTPGPPVYASYGNTWQRHPEWHMPMAFVPPSHHQLSYPPQPSVHPYPHVISATPYMPMYPAPQHVRVYYDTPHAPPPAYPPQHAQQVAVHQPPLHESPSTSITEMRKRGAIEASSVPKRRKLKKGERSDRSLEKYRIMERVLAKLLPIDGPEDKVVCAPDIAAAMTDAELMQFCTKRDVTGAKKLQNVEHNLKQGWGLWKKIEMRKGSLAREFYEKNAYELVDSDRHCTWNGVRRKQASAAVRQPGGLICDVGGTVPTV